MKSASGFWRETRTPRRKPQQNSGPRTKSFETIPDFGSLINAIQLVWRMYRTGKSLSLRRSSSILQSISRIQRSSIAQTLKNPNDLASWHRFTIQITLNLNAAFEVQTSHLLLRLNTFGGGDHAKAHAKARDGADNSKASLVDEQVSDKRLIDLDLVERETTKIANAGIAGAEIIHRYTNAKVPQLIEDRDVAFRLLKQHGFSDFELETGGRKSRRG